MTTHVIPDGEADRHFPCGGCHCEPWEQATTDDHGQVTWRWCHEALGERRKRRHTERVE